MLPSRESLVAYVGSIVLLAALGACRSAAPNPSVDATNVAAPAASSSSAAPAGAPRPVQEPARYENLYRRAGIAIGGAFYRNFDTSMRVDSDVLVGAVLDLEDFLGMDDSNSVARVDAFYSFSPRHRLEFSVYDIQRDGSRNIGQPIDVGNVTIPAGQVESELETLIIKADYRYNFVADTRTAIGASIGLHTMDIDFGIQTANGSVSEDFRATAPLPVIGLHVDYALSERWKMVMSTEVFQIDIGDFSGFLADNRLGIEHDLFDHFGWGITFNSFQLDAEAEGNGHLSAEMEYAYQGAMLFLRGYL